MTKCAFLPCFTAGNHASLTKKQRNFRRSVNLPLALSTGDISKVDVPVPSYEPMLPQTEILVGMVLITLVSLIACWVWGNQVVPVSRAKLAISKSRGEVKEYLDDLKASDPSLVVETEEVTNINEAAVDEKATILSVVKKDDRAFERWLFSDWLRDNKSERRAGRQKDAALPFLKDAKWNSGDNPVLAATALILVGVLFSSLLERLASFAG